ncbi:hypothetical protein I0C86_37245 [Plantactinospora sp. S1510]|uniref:Carbohydrate kinase PfkB domain-containing protein n=1 Tax=Plantactinospora alkalitolerans TaxID=2789879 RepID=A0ABS0H7V7_9ACTN|nr:hypothetical protein [Plantactinospora alkalitolerans]MBF9134535.1 hypothetical protein [Plantactinospora alkalitolerans]
MLGTRDITTRAGRYVASAVAITVLGEAIVDLVEGPDGRFTAHPGGSPLNVVIGLTRLGLPTRPLARRDR